MELDFLVRSLSTTMVTPACTLASIVTLCRVHRRNATRSAAMKFRNAVLATFEGLYPAPTRWPENLDSYLRNVFAHLQVAVEEFRPFVPWHQRTAFETAWFHYRCATGRDIDTQCYHHYLLGSEKKQTFRRNIDKLLSFGG